MNSRTLAVLAAVLAVLAAAAAVAVKRAGKPSDQRLLWSGDAAKISTITLTRPSGTVVLARRKDGWDLKEPLQLPANPDATQQLLERLPKTVLNGPLSASREKDATFGLDAATAIRLKAEGDKPLDLWAGKAAPGYDTLYVRLGDAPEVYEASGLGRYDVERSSMDWVDKAVVRIPPAQLDRVVLKSSYTIALTRSGEAWTREDKGVTVSTAPGSPINVIQGSLNNFEADEVMLGTPKGKATLEIRLESGGKDAKTEHVLKVYPVDANRLAVAAPGATIYYLMHPWRLDSFRKPPSEFQ